jgi:hypothetical protein
MSLLQLFEFLQHLGWRIFRKNIRKFYGSHFFCHQLKTAQISKKKRAENVRQIDMKLRHFSDFRLLKGNFNPCLIRPNIVSGAGNRVPTWHSSLPVFRSAGERGSILLPLERVAAVDDPLVGGQELPRHLHVPNCSHTKTDALTVGREKFTSCSISLEYQDLAQPPREEEFYLPHTLSSLGRQINAGNFPSSLFSRELIFALVSLKGLSHEIDF